jgi:hypothetical protein
MAAGLELLGNVDVSAGPSVKKESLGTAEHFHGDSARSSPLSMAPPQFFTRIRLRLLTADEISGTPHFIMARDSGMTFDAYTREKMSPDVIGKKVRCERNCHDAERDGVYRMRQMRALLLSREPSMRTPHTFGLGTRF